MAHEFCPYSKATQGDINVDLNVKCCQISIKLKRLFNVINKIHIKFKFANQKIFWLVIFLIVIEISGNI